MNPKTDRCLKKTANICRLKVYCQRQPSINLSNSSVFQTCSTSDNELATMLSGTCTSSNDYDLDSSIPHLPPPLPFIQHQHVGQSKRQLFPSKSRQHFVSSSENSSCLDNSTAILPPHEVTLEQDFVGANDSTPKIRCGFFLSMDTVGLSPITSQSPFVRLSLSEQQETHSLSQMLQELPSYPTETMKIP